MPTLNFKGKAVIETYHHTVPHHRLEFDPKLSLLPKGTKPSLDGNLIIEGDNLLALKALLPTHAGKIKCVYIDPPYNTGNEGWVYNDNLTQPQFKEWIGKTVGKEGEDATRHDKWCCMMYPRLSLLKELLAQDGVLLVSIGDDEVGNLRLLLDEVFQEHNFVAHICWQKRYVSNVTALFLSDMHDHILVYAKDRTKTKVNKLERTEEQLEDYQNPDDDPRGVWRAQDLSASKPYKAGVFKIKGPTGKTFDPPPSRFWRCSETQYKKWLADDRIWFGKEDTARPMLKSFLAESDGGITPNTWWSYQFAGHNKEATLELKELFEGESPFDNPKPVRLIRRILETFSTRSALVMDSFAGSGTTAQAVLEMNAHDGGDRRFILVQQRYDNKTQETENKNVAAITRERVKRVKASSNSFTFAQVGDALFSEYRDLGEKLPKFEELAKYIFYTETSRECDLKKINEATGFIGSTEAAGGTSYYLFYTPNKKEDRELSTQTLKTLLKKDKSRSWVIYCEKIWLHGDQLRKFEKDHGKRVRPMLVPFNLK
jgi:adenine-specific DNA-methyltransferase